MKHFKNCFYNGFALHIKPQRLIWKDAPETPATPERKKRRTKADLEKLDEKITENTDLLAVRFYRLGEYELKSGPKAPQDKTKLIDGSADATQWDPSKMKEGRYKKIASYASVLLDILDTDPDRFTQKTRDFLLPKKDILTVVAGLKPSDFPEKLEKKYSFDEVFGAEGIYNIVIAFQRIVNLSGKSAKSLAKDNTIKLAISIGEHVKEEKERFAKAYGEGNITVLEAELGGSALKKEAVSKIAPVIEEVLRTTAPTKSAPAEAPGQAPAEAAPTEPPVAPPAAPPPAAAPPPRVAPLPTPETPAAVPLTPAPTPPEVPPAAPTQPVAPPIPPVVLPEAAPPPSAAKPSESPPPTPAPPEAPPAGPKPLSPEQQNKLGDITHRLNEIGLRLRHGGIKIKLADATPENLEKLGFYDVRLAELDKALRQLKEAELAQISDITLSVKFPLISESQIQKPEGKRSLTIPFYPRSEQIKKTIERLIYLPPPPTAPVPETETLKNAAPPKTSEDWKKEADKFKVAGKLEEAIAAYQKAIDGDPNNANLYFDLGIVYYNAKRYQEAVAAYDKIIEKDPTLTNAYHNKALSLGKAGRFQEAVTTYKHYINLVPNEPDSFYGLAQALQAGGDKQGALENFRKYVEMEKHPEQQKWIDLANQKIAKLDQELQKVATPPESASPPAAKTPEGPPLK